MSTFHSKNLIGSQWVLENEELIRTFKFSNFKEAWFFMNQVAVIAEKLNHHPNWYNSFNLVEIRLNTHELGRKVTEKDWALAKEIDLIYSK